MNPDSQSDIFATSQMLADRGEYDQALACVEKADCVMGEWLKGKIYLDCAQQFSTSFAFKYYPTTEMKLHYRNILNLAYNHLYKAILNLPGATDDVKQTLNNCIWNQIAKVENEISMTREAVQDEDDLGIEEDYDSYQQLRTEILIDDIARWRF